MSATNPALSTIINVFNNLSYEPVLDSDASVKSWISSHNNGLFTPFINGKFINQNEKQLGSVFDIKNPFNGNSLAKAVNCDMETLNLALESCSNSLDSWRGLGTLERGRIIYNIARNVQKNLQILVSCESLNSGRTSREVKDLDIASVVKTLYYYSGSVGFDNQQDYESLGVVAIAGHYDSSLLSMVNKLAPSLATGNTVLLIPNKLTPLSAFMFMDLCVQSGVPAGVINLVVNESDELYKMVSRDQRVSCICFDGRVKDSQDLVLSQSFLHPFKQTVLSLEGKSSLVIYESADLDSAIEGVVDGCFYSNGQHRYSLNKVFIQESVFEDVWKRLDSRFNKLRVGNHLDKCNDFGPMVNINDLTQFRETLSQQISENESGVHEYPNIDTKSSNSLASPVIFKNIGLNSKINLNEVNGPYVIIIPFRTVKESVDLLNVSRFGSSISLYSQNISLVMEAAYLLNAGTIWINGFPIERGVQTRKQSGNFQILGFKSLRNFLRLKSENQNSISSNVDFDQALRQLKLFGSASPTATIPSGTKLNEEKTYKLYIGGKQTRPDTQSSRAVYLPGEKDQVYCLVADASRKDVRNAVEAAHSAFNGWWKRPNHNKSQILYYFGENLNTRSNEFVSKLELFTQKSKKECENELKLCSDVIFYYASVVDKYIGHLNDTSEYGYLLESLEPLGIIAVICGHNSNDNNPLLKFILHLTAAIAFGNTVIIVPDERSIFPAINLYEIFETSDMPDGVVNILTGPKHHLTKYLCEHQQLNAIWYMNDIDNDSATAENELNAQRFIKHTSAFNQKQSWLINNSKINLDDKFISRVYLDELKLHSIQSKYINIPMGTIFAN